METPQLEGLDELTWTLVKINIPKTKGAKSPIKASLWLWVKKVKAEIIRGPRIEAKRPTRLKTPKYSPRWLLGLIWENKDRERLWTPPWAIAIIMASPQNSQASDICMAHAIAITYKLNKKIKIDN